MFATSVNIRQFELSKDLGRIFAKSRNKEAPRTDPSGPSEGSSDILATPWTKLSKKAWTGFI